MKRWVSGAAIDEIPTNEPPPARTIAAAVCFKVKKAPVRLMAMTSFHA